MPRIALLLFPAVLAVSALPPFNGFLSEWFLYRGLISSFTRGESWAACLALPALAIAGGLAAVAFAKFYGFVFLGEPRTPSVEHAHDPGKAMLIPMAILALLCLAMGLGSTLLLPVLDRIIRIIAPETEGLLVPGLSRDLTWLSALLGLLLVIGLPGFLWLQRSKRRSADPSAPEIPTWDCGYARPTARMQYTGSSFANGWATLVPGFRIRMRRIRAIFPTPLTFRTTFKDAVGDSFVDPMLGRFADRLIRFRQLQHGQVALYLLYILLALLITFMWMLLRPRLLG